MTSWIATPIDDETIYHYASARVAAYRYVELQGQLTGEVQGVDPERLAMAHTNPKVKACAPDGVRRLDEYMAIQRVFDAAKNSLVRHRKAQGERWWICWWAMRVDGHSATHAATGYSERRSREIRRKVDRIIETQLDEQQMYKTRCDLDAIEEYNKTPRERVEVVEFIYEDEEDQG